MDKYIFRGKCTGTDMWVMGNLLGKDVIIPSGQPYYLDEGFINGNIRGYEVDPDTVGIYIGRRDAHGRMIFTGDIVTFRGVYGHAYIEPVKFLEYEMHPFDLFNQEDAEIIGNIYEHAELLEDKWIRI